MKITPNVIYGGIAALAGIATLYYTRLKALQAPAQINVLPPLSNSPSYAPGQPTANGASIPAFYASPFSVGQVPQQPPTQLPYQVYNMPPTHVAHKKALQVAAASAAQPAQTTGCGCGCSDASKCSTYGPVTNVPANFGPSETRNMNGVGLRPILTPKIGATQSIYSPSTAFNLATQQTVPAVYAMSNQGQTLIGNVPSISDYN